MTSQQKANTHHVTMQNITALIATKLGPKTCRKPENQKLKSSSETTAALPPHPFCISQLFATHSAESSAKSPRCANVGESQSTKSSRVTSKRFGQQTVCSRPPPPAHHTSSVGDCLRKIDKARNVPRISPVQSMLYDTTF